MTTLKEKNSELKRKLTEAQNELQAISEGAVDGIVVQGSTKKQLYLLENTTLTMLVESIVEAFLATDKNLKFVYANKQAEIILSKKREALLGKSCRELFQNSKSSLLYRYAKRSMREQKTFVYEEYQKLLQKWFIVTLYPSVNGLTILIKDITEQKQFKQELKESEERFKLLVEGAKDFAIMMLDKKGVVTSWNKGAENLLGYTEKEIVGSNFSIFFTPEDKKKKMPSRELRLALQTGVANNENWMMRKDGSSFWASDVTRAVYDEKGTLKGLAKIARDVTARMQLEKQKDDFMSIASHELKTPVTSLKAYTQVMLLTFKKKGDSQAVASLAKMDAQLNKLTDLIGDLLDVTKIEAGKLQLNPQYFDFDELVGETVESMQLTTEKHTLIVEGIASKKVYADKDRIGQVITNLISNAIKYSPHTKEIIITLAKEHDMVIVRVKDYGVGIPKEKQKKVFERFFRVSGPKAQTFPGLGLGLYISSEIIKRLGGKIWVESSQGKGSTFCFTLPIEKKEIINEKNTLLEEEVKHS